MQYNDENFEGVCLKITDTFIQLNPSIAPTLENLKNELNKAIYI